jgi:hypothetical protein
MRICFGEEFQAHVAEAFGPFVAFVRLGRRRPGGSGRGGWGRCPRRRCVGGICRPMRWVRQRCQLAPGSAEPIAATSPSRNFGTANSTGTTDLISLRRHPRVRKRGNHFPEQIRARRGQVLFQHPGGGSTLCGAAIVVILSRVPWSVLHENHAVAVSHHDATPLTSEKLVHHLRRRNRTVFGASMLICQSGSRAYSGASTGWRQRH